ncbi:calcium/sodium antiporter [Nocardia sp. MDA0666]|uniref:calcium/sodium antiporter n=1 Tax=Nocardia sp. MDA0666 TaxID=2135448 RepID=UPI002104A3F1|nr:calcium/sodium antiporter [Nocardia sp. MDA0666]
MLGVVFGLVVLAVAADQLVVGSARVAQKLRITPAVVGVVIIGLGTSAPEFLVSGTAAAAGHADIATGNLIGSNIINLTLILGLVAALGGVTTTARVINREITASVFAVALFALAVAIGLTVWTGAVLWVVAGAALFILVRWSKSDRSNITVAEQAIEFTGSETGTPPGAWSTAVMRAVGGLVGVLIGAQLLVTDAAAIATEFGVSQLVIGFTLVALGTSLPELVTAVQAQRRGESDLLVGNLFGSNLFNSLAGGGVVGMCSTNTTSPAVGALPLIIMVAVSILAWVVLRRDLRLSRPEGALLLLGYLASAPILLSM